MSSYASSPKPAGRPQHGDYAPILPAPTLGQRTSKALAVGRGRAAPSSEPDLLHRLLRFVRDGLIEGGVTDPSSASFTDDRLEVFRRAFSHFISNFGAYSPLLLGVQEAYEDALEQARSNAVGVEELTARLALMEKETSQLLAHYKQDAATDHDGLAAEIAQRDERVRLAERESGKLQNEVRRLRNDLQYTQRQRDDARLENVELAKQVEYWQSEAAEMRRLASGEGNELEALRKRVKDLEERQRDFVNEEAMQRQEYEETTHELEMLKQTTVPARDHKNVVAELTRTQVNLKTAKEDAKELRFLLSGGESHAQFPNGLEWAGSSVLGVDYLDPGWRGKRVGAIVKELVDDTLKLHGQLADERRQRGGGGGMPPTASAASAAAAATTAEEGGEEGGEEGEDQEGTPPPPLLVAEEPLFDPARGPLFTLDEDDADVSGVSGGGSGGGGIDAEEVRLLRGEVKRVRISGSSYDGVVRLRPELWGIDEVRAAVRRLWMEYKRRVLSVSGGRRREAAMPPSKTVEILHELITQLLTSREKELRPDAGATMHKGLLCADTYNLQAAMWGLRSVEPHAAIFAQVVIGRLPPATYAELHKACNGLFRSLTAAAGKADKVAVEVLLPKLETQFPYATADQLDRVVSLLGGHKDGVDSAEVLVSIAPLAPLPKEPCESEQLPNKVQLCLMRLFLGMMLTMRADVEASILRTAAARSDFNQNPVAGQGKLPVSASDLRAALLRVDAIFPEAAISDHVKRVFDAISAARDAKANAEEDKGDQAFASFGDGAVAAANDAAALAKSSEATAEVDEVCMLLFAEPLRRYSPRTDPDLREKIEGELKKAAAGGGKKGKGGGKKAKGAADAVAMVSSSQLRDAVLKADAKRPLFEAEELASSCIASARRASPPPPASPPPSRPASPTQSEPSEEQAPLDAVLAALQNALIQPTSERSESQSAK